MGVNKSLAGNRRPLVAFRSQGLSETSSPVWNSTCQWHLCLMFQKTHLCGGVNRIKFGLKEKPDNDEATLGFFGLPSPG